MPICSQFIAHFHQAVLENNLAEITVAYESGWNRLTEKYYAKTEWPEAEVIAPLVNDGQWQNALCSISSIFIPHTCRPNIPDPLPRTLLPSRLLKTQPRHRRPLPFVREQLRTVQLLAEYDHHVRRAYWF